MAKTKTTTHSHKGEAAHEGHKKGAHGSHKGSDASKSSAAHGKTHADKGWQEEKSEE